MCFPALGILVQGFLFQSRDPGFWVVNLGVGGGSEKRRNPRALVLGWRELKRRREVVYAESTLSSGPSSAVQVSASSVTGPKLVPSRINHHQLLYLHICLYVMCEKLSSSLKTNFSNPLYMIFMSFHHFQRMLLEPLLEFLFIPYLMWYKTECTIIRAIEDSGSGEWPGNDKTLKGKVRPE